MAAEGEASLCSVVRRVEQSHIVIDGSLGEEQQLNGGFLDGEAIQHVSQMRQINALVSGNKDKLHRLHGPTKEGERFQRALEYNFFIEQALLTEEKVPKEEPIEKSGVIGYKNGRFVILVERITGHDKVDTIYVIA